MTDDRSPADDFEALAGEHALGVLDGADLARARALAASDPKFRAEVEAWSAQLSPLLDEVAPAKPPASVWQRIAQATGPEVEEDNVVRLERKLFLWRSISGGLATVAATLALFLLMLRSAPLPTPPPAAPIPAAAPMVARLSGNKHLALVASFDPGRNQLVLAAAAGLAPTAAHSHELWIIPAGGKPRSLGVMPQRDAAVVRLSADAGRLMRAGGTVAVTVEPLGGSPSGAPTGPIVASGTLQAA